MRPVGRLPTNCTLCQSKQKQKPPDIDGKLSQFLFMEIRINGCEFSMPLCRVDQQSNPSTHRILSPHADKKNAEQSHSLTRPIQARRSQSSALPRRISAPSGGVFLLLYLRGAGSLLLQQYEGKGPLRPKNEGALCSKEFCVIHRGLDVDRIQIKRGGSRKLMDLRFRDGCRLIY